MQIAPVASLCLEQLAAMLLEVCKNPTQPGFNHYLFESVAGLIRHSAAADPAKVAELEASLFPAFNVVLQQDVQVGNSWQSKVISGACLPVPKCPGNGACIELSYSALQAAASMTCRIINLSGAHYCTLNATWPLDARVRCAPEAACADPTRCALHRRRSSTRTCSRSLRSS